MGWSWAPFIAHILMLEIFERALDPSGSRRVANGHPTPPSSTTTPVHWGYIDDYGVGLLQRIGIDIESSPPGCLQERANQAFKETGVTPHKTILSPGLPDTLGVQVRGHQLAPRTEKFWWFTRPAEHAAELPYLAPIGLQKVLGGLTRFNLICREMLSVFSSVY